MTWVEAVDYSKSLGGHLVTISDEEENRFVTDLGQTMYDGWVSHNSFWIGLTDEGQEGRFLWVTGESNSYTNWSGSEPNNSGNEDYVTIGQNSSDTWNDHPSKDNRPFVVEFESRPPAVGITIPTAVSTATPLPSPTFTPIPAPNVVAKSAGIIVSDSELLSQSWVQGQRPDIPNYKWGSGSGSQVADFSLNSDNVTLFASDYSLSNVLKIILFKSSDGGRTWLQVGTSSGRCENGPHRGDLLIFDMNDPKKILGYCSEDWWQSEDGGESWILSDFAPPGGPIIYPDVIYAGGRFRSEDGGQTWRELITEYPISRGTPGYPSALYAIKTHTTFSIEIFLSRDGTVTWNRVETPQAKDEPYFIFTFDSSNPPNIVLGFPEEGLFRANALDPKDWELLLWPPGAIGLKEVALHPTNPDVLAFTDDDDGVFITFDGADSWVPLHQAGYQVGIVVYNGLPIFSGGRRPLVLIGGSRPTICIGSDTGPWCHGLSQD